MYFYDFYVCRSKFSVIVQRLLKNFYVSNACNHSAMDLKEVITRLNIFAPLQLAEKWDNVGLLVEPSPPHSVKSVLLTNDLTERVVQEAVDKKVSMVISYHPPIFVPLKRLTCETFKERIIVQMIENRIAVYSPHTAFDAVKNGVNDWLAAGLGKARVDPLECSKDQSSGVKLVTRMLANQEPDLITSVQDKLKDFESVERIEVETVMRPQGLTEQQLSMHCSESRLVGTLQTLTSLLPESVGKVEVVPLAQIPMLDTGQGRLCTLQSPVTLSELITRTKNHLNLKHVRLAAAHGGTSEDPLQSSIQTIALCAGSGASVLRGKKADVYLTGEMSHHEVLDAVSSGVHVILCEHSNTERGFLTEFRCKLVELLEGKVDIMVSSNDADPLQIF